MWSPLRDYNYAVHKLLQDAAQRHLAGIHGRVLDVGCGSSPYRDLLPPDAVYIGIDRTPQAHTALLAVGEALPFADSTFDGILCTEMLEQSPRPWQVLPELARVLKRGGKLYVTAPFDWHFLDDHDYFRFTESGLRTLLADAGLEVETLELLGGMFSSFAGKLLEQLVVQGWLRVARAAGIRRGAYFAAAVASLPWNLTAGAVAPIFDRLSTRNPFSIAAVAVRR